MTQLNAGLRGYAEALLLVAASTLIGLLIAPRWGSAPVDLVYLPAVLAAAVLAGLRPALLAATASALAYNYFFTAPFHTFRIHSPADVVTVIVLFIVALVTSHLAASIRKQARLASDHADRNATIAGLARQLLSCSSEDAIAEVGVRELAKLFDCNVSLLSPQPELHIVSAHPKNISLTPTDFAATALVISTGEATGRGLTRVITTEWQVHPVCSSSTTIAAVALARDDGRPPVLPDQLPLLGNLLDQIALALERARLEAEARAFAGMRDRDRLRTTLLATIDDDLTPPMANIGKAVAALRRGGSADRSVLSDITSELTSLQRYLANLHDLGSDSDQKPIEIGSLKIDLFNRSVFRNGQEIHLTPKEYAVLAELAKFPGRVLSHAQLMRSAWGPAQERQTEYLRVAVRALRQKLEDEPTEPTLIINEPAIGYRLARNAAEAAG